MVACVRDRGGSCIINVCNRLKTYYIYALFDIRLWLPFYVGHSTRPYKRLAEHIQGAALIVDDIPGFFDVYDKKVYIRHMLDSGIDPVMVLLDEIDTMLSRLLWCAASAHVRLPHRGRRSRAQAPPRTASQPGGETRRGKEHAGKAEWPERM